MHEWNRGDWFDGDFALVMVVSTTAQLYWLADRTELVLMLQDAEIGNRMLHLLGELAGSGGVFGDQ